MIKDVLHGQKKYILEQAKAGVSYKEIAKALNKAGHTNNDGKPVNNQDISYRCCKWGFRKKKFSSKSKAQPKQKESLLQDVEDIVTSPIRSELKERLLKQLLA